MTFQLLQNGVPVTSYSGGSSYQLKLSGSTFRGFIIASFRGTQSFVGTAFSAAPKAGVLTAADSSAASMQGSCSSGVTQTTSKSRTSQTVNWVAPPSGTGTVTIFGQIVVSLNTNWRVYLEIPEAAASTSSTASVTAAPPTPSNTATMSDGASRSQTATNTRSISQSATVTPSRSPPAPGPAASQYRYKTALDSVLTLFWTPRLADGAIDFRMEAPGRRWLGLAPNPYARDMLTSGAAALGTLDDMAVKSTFLRSRELGDVSTWNAAATATLSSSGVHYNRSGTGTTSVWWSRPLTPPPNLTAIGDIDLAQHLALPMGWIYAYGPNNASGTGALSMHEASGYIELTLFPELCQRQVNCSNRGDCNGAGQCVCDIGYGGSDCSGCSALFQPVATTSSSSTSALVSGGGSGGAITSTECVLFDRVLRATSMAITVNVRLANVENDTATDPDLRIQFANIMAVVIRRQIGMGDATDIAITGASPPGVGPMTSMTLTFATKMSSTALAGNSSAAGTGNASSTSVYNALKAFQAALNDPESPLMTSAAGYYLLVPPTDGATAYAGTALATLASSASSYDHSADLQLKDGMPMKLSWTIEPDATPDVSGNSGGNSSGATGGWLNGEITFGGNAWFGIAFGDSEMMVPTDALACEPGSSSGQQVNYYLLNGYTDSECPAAPDGVDILDPEFSFVFPAVSGAGFVCRFRRRLDWVGGALPMSVSAGGGSITPKSLSKGEVWVTSAHGSDGRLTVGTHSTSQSGAILVDLMAGTTRVPENIYAYIAFLAHAGVGAIAVVILLPSAVCISRYGRGIGGKTPHDEGPFALWFRYHWLLSTAGTVALFMAFGLGLVYDVQNANTPQSIATMMDWVRVTKQHFGSVHSMLALATTGLAILVNVISMGPCRPRWPLSLLPSTLANAIPPALVKAAAQGGPKSKAQFALAKALATQKKRSGRWNVWAVCHAVMGTSILFGGAALIFTGLLGRSITVAGYEFQTGNDKIYLTSAKTPPMSDYSRYAGLISYSFLICVSCITMIACECGRHCTAKSGKPLSRKEQLTSTAAEIKARAYALAARAMDAVPANIRHMNSHGGGAKGGPPNQHQQQQAQLFGRHSVADSEGSQSYNSPTNADRAESRAEPRSSAGAAPARGGSNTSNSNSSGGGFMGGMFRRKDGAAPPTTTAAGGGATSANDGGRGRQQQQQQQQPSAAAGSIEMAPLSASTSPTRARPYARGTVPQTIREDDGDGEYEDDRGQRRGAAASSSAKTQAPVAPPPAGGRAKEPAPPSSVKKGGALWGLNPWGGTYVAKPAPAGDAAASVLQPKPPPQPRSPIKQQEAPAAAVVVSKPVVPTPPPAAKSSARKESSLASAFSRPFGGMGGGSGGGSRSRPPAGTQFVVDDEGRLVPVTSAAAGGAIGRTPGAGGGISRGMSYAVDDIDADFKF